MKEENANRKRVIRLRLTAKENGLLEKKWRKTTSRTMSEYVRHCLFEKPIVTTYRNKSLDEFMGEMILLRDELNYIGHNWNQVVKRLHTLNHIQEFKIWLVNYHIEKSTLMNKMDEIKIHIQKIAESWLQ